MRRRKDGISIIIHLPLPETNRRGDVQWSTTASEALSARAIVQPEASGAHSKVIGHVAGERFTVLLDPVVGGHDFSDEEEISRLRFGFIEIDGRRADVRTADFIGHGSPRGMRHVEISAQINNSGKESA